MSALLLLLAAQAAAASVPEPQALLSVMVVVEGAPAAEQGVERRTPFAVQRVNLESGLAFDLPPAALRDRLAPYHLDARSLFILTEWLAIGPEPEPALRRLGLLHCGSRVTWGTNHVCFRDADGDGRLERVAVFRNNVPAGGLTFDPIEPIPYHYVQAPRSGEGGTSDSSLGFGWDRERDTGRLRFFAQVAGGNWRAEVDPPAIVDPAHLPATVEIAGAQLTVLSYDGRRPVVRVDRPFPPGPTRAMSPGSLADFSLYLSIMGGTGHGWRLQANDIVLPGEPAPR